jgi:hypothetical protein
LNRHDERLGASQLRSIGWITQLDLESLVRAGECVVKNRDGDHGCRLALGKVQRSGICLEFDAIHGRDLVQRVIHTDSPRAAPQSFHRQVGDTRGFGDRNPRYGELDASWPDVPKVIRST